MIEAGTATTLKIVPALRAGRSGDGRIVLPRKFVDGLAQFRKLWRGPMTVYMAQGPFSSGNLDNYAFFPTDLPCELLVLPHTEFGSALTTGARSVALLALDDFRQSHLSALCRAYGIPCAYTTEYSLLTRKQIVDATTANPLLRIRRKFWESRQENQRRRAVRFAAGLQCNGTPTFNAYRKTCPNALLFFDTRVAPAMVATEDEVRRKAAGATIARPLQLLFSGRLARMKGVMHLIDVAKVLRKLHVDFHLAICGDGELKGELSRRIADEGLAQLVSLKGTLDFATELMPFVKRSVDLFICCHPQGDPSCTYLETMSGGVPIIGYANEAFEGVVRASEAGWLVPINEPNALAAEVARIQKRPEELLEMSLKALGFAREHTCERTFARRAEHLRALSY